MRTSGKQMKGKKNERRTEGIGRIIVGRGEVTAGKGSIQASQ